MDKFEAQKSIWLEELFAFTKNYYQMRKNQCRIMTKSEILPLIIMA